MVISPGRRISRESAREALFPSLTPEAAARSLYKAQSMARLALKEIGPKAAGMLSADPVQIWVSANTDLAVDLEAHEQALRAALQTKGGSGRDSALVDALSTGGVPLEDEPEAEWAARVRERVEYLRQEARLELARDRARGVGRAHPEQLLDAWQACLQADPSDEEAASALMRLYLAQGRRPLAIGTYERCSGALAALGLRTSLSLDELRASADRAPSHTRPVSPVGPSMATAAGGEERRLLSVVFVELSPLGLGLQADPEDLREVIGAALGQAINEVEAFGGTVASISGTGMCVFFGAPQAHEDDPERALRAGLRLVNVARVANEHADHGRRQSGGRWPKVALSVRVGVETGPAVTGPAGGADGAGYRAVGGVVGAAAVLQSAARPGSVLVGAATRRATEGIFESGPVLDVPLSPGTERLAATYLVQPRASPAAEPGRRRLAAQAPLVGRDTELTVLTQAVRATVSGRGGVVVVTGEPGVGKTRLIEECRHYFMGWVGASSGRLPLWLDGRCASYASSTPYGAYQQLLSRFIGVPLEAGEGPPARARSGDAGRPREGHGDCLVAGPHDGLAGRGG